jgi:hypothetical protein
MGVEGDHVHHHQVFARSLPSTLHRDDTRSGCRVVAESSLDEDLHGSGQNGALVSADASAFQQYGFWRAFGCG